MKKQIAVIVVAFVAVTFSLAWSGGKDWAIKAQYAESCSCSVPCPCTFGSSATRGHCDANGLVEIEKGHLGKVELDGISVVMTTRLGEWAKFYVSDFATDKQVDAVIELLKNESVFGAYFPEKVKILSVDKKPINIERNGSRIKFSAANTFVEIEKVVGLDGKPIKIQNLPLLALADHTQYKSITNRHQSTDKEFSYSATNGLTSTIDISSE